VTSYASKTISSEKFVNLMVTFKFCPKGITVLPCSLRGRVFSRTGEKKDNFVFIYEFFSDFDISFPLIDFEHVLLFVLFVAPNPLYPDS